MQSFRLLAAIGALAMLSPARLAAQQSPADEVNVLVTRYKGEFAALASSEEASVAPVIAAYVKEIERLRDTAKAKGDLNGLIEVEPALEAIRQGQNPPVAKSPTSAVAAARLAFEKNKAQALRFTQPKRARLEADYVRSFTELEQRYTRAGNLDAAKLAREARLSIPGGRMELLPTMLGNKDVKESYVVSSDEAGLKTEARFQPPIEIEYTLKTSSQVRLCYAANDIIFNWEVNKNELRIDGGPAAGQHQPGAGAIPAKELVTIRQVVLPGSMSVSVDGRERARWNRDFSQVDGTIGIRGTHGAVLQIKQITIRKLSQKP